MQLTIWHFHLDAKESPHTSSVQNWASETPSKGDSFNLSHVSKYHFHPAQLPKPKTRESRLSFFFSHIYNLKGNTLDMTSKCAITRMWTAAYTFIQATTIPSPDHPPAPKMLPLPCPTHPQGAGGTCESPGLQVLFGLHQDLRQPGDGHTHVGRIALSCGSSVSDPPSPGVPRR